LNAVRLKNRGKNKQNRESQRLGIFYKERKKQAGETRFDVDSWRREWVQNEKKIHGLWF
jgi:hypothetical protein